VKFQVSKNSVIALILLASATSAFVSSCGNPEDAKSAVKAAAAAADSEGSSALALRSIETSQLSTSTDWDFPCDVPRNPTGIFIFGERHVGGIVSISEKEKRETILQKEILFEPLTFQRNLIGREGILNGDTSTLLRRAENEGFFVEKQDSFHLFGLESDYSLSVSIFAGFYSAFWSPDLFPVAQEVNYRVLRSKVLAQFLVLLVNSPVSKRSWMSMKRPLQDPDAEKVANLFDRFLDNASALARWVEDEGMFLWVASSPATGKTLQQWGLSLIHEIETHPTPEFIADKITLEPIKKVLLDAKLASLANKGGASLSKSIANYYLLHWRNRDWTRNIGKAYCEAQKAPRYNISVIVGGGHVDDLKEMLEKATRGKVEVVAN
jgi:hypothetical protein